MFNQLPEAACLVTLCYVELLTGESFPLIDMQVTAGHSTLLPPTFIH